MSSQAEALYQVTDYQASLRILNVDTAPDAATFALMGKNHFMLGDYRRATEFFEKALALNPRSSEFELWLGRAYGKRAATTLGYLVFNNFPDSWTWIGASLIVASGIYIALRERRRRRA